MKSPIYLILALLMCKIGIAQSVKNIKTPIWESKNIKSLVSCNNTEMDGIIKVEDSLIYLYGFTDCTDGLEETPLMISFDINTGSLVGISNEERKVINDSLSKINFNAPKEKYLTQEKQAEIQSKFVIDNSSIRLYSKRFHNDSLYLFIKKNNILTGELIYNSIIDTVLYNDFICTSIIDENLIYFSGSTKNIINIVNGKKTGSIQNKIYFEVTNYEMFKNLELIIKPNFLTFKDHKNKTYKIRGFFTCKGDDIFIYKNSLYILRNFILSKYSLDKKSR